MNPFSQGQNPDAAQDGDFMSEAKDWAGELISGQTGTGRILVRYIRTNSDCQNTGKIYKDTQELARYW